MIITSAPFRITLAGGGTDLPSYYEKHGGFIFAMAINHYMYVMTNPPTIDSKIRLHYSSSECVDHVSEIKHDLAREALRYLGFENKMEISSMADLPGGTGLGSSSSYLVALLMALHQHKREHVTLYQIAEEACKIEINILNKNIGKQDQYMAAFGGLTSLEISIDGKVDVKQEKMHPSALNEFISNTHLYYTGIQRQAQDILKEQNDSLKSEMKNSRNLVEENLSKIKELGRQMYNEFKKENFDEWGILTHEHWLTKKKLSKSITLSKVENLYLIAKNNYNVLGGKIVGAGGGGFLLLYCQTEHRKLEDFMKLQGMNRLHYSIATEGCKQVASLSSLNDSFFSIKN